MCMLPIGQSNSNQSEPCKSDLKTTWQQPHDSTAKSVLLMDVNYTGAF